MKATAPPGRLLAVIATSKECEPCSRLRRRLGRLENVDTAFVEVGDSGAVERLGIDRVPQLWLVDSSGDVVRHWVGEPLAGTLERTVTEALTPSADT